MRKLINFFNNIELHIASVAICITTFLVILNVFLRYGSSKQFLWTEEVALGCFVWTVFLGAAAAYKRGRLMGVNMIILLLPKKIGEIVEFIMTLFVLVLNVTLTYMSYTYMLTSRKVTAALEVSYVYINFSLVLTFFLISIYALQLVIQKFKIMIVTDKS